MPKQLYLPFLLMIISIVGSAQNGNEFLGFKQAGEQRSIYHQSIYFNDRYSSSFDAGTYLGIGTNVWTRLGFRASVIRKFDHRWSGDLGFMYNHVTYENRVSQEFRPHQTVAFRKTIFGASSLQHRLRLEERIFVVDNSSERQVKSRLRYRIYYKGRFDGQPVHPKAFFYRVSTEWNFNIYNESEDHFFLRGRYGVGAGYQFNSRFSCDANYFYEHNSVSGSNHQSILHIFHVALRHSIYLK